MSNAFKPLFPELPKGQEAAGEFTKLKICPAEQVPTVAAPAKATSDLPAPARSTAPVLHGEPQITLQRDGERITNIRIECRCGEVFLLDCTY